MAIEPTKLQVNVNDSNSVSALLYIAPKKIRLGVTLILGHGAGASQLSGFMRLFANGLAERGVDVVTFNFIYMEQGRHVPDPKPKLEACYVAVIDAAGKHKKLKGNRIAVGGKSMGGRIGSQVAALNDQELADVGASASTAASELAGVVLLGYPLHPPGRPDKLRDAHLKDIRAPILFVQGSRDAFGTRDELQAAIKKHRLNATLYVVEGGDHSLKVPKSLGLPQDEVYAAAMDRISDWL
jgi:predicted alpha/beta-hydrolase family hydrolase